MKKFIIKTLGCKVNQYDSLTLRKKLVQAGFEYKPKDGEKIDLVVINSCAVTKTSIRKGRRTLALAKRENPNAKIVLLGCWAKTYPEEMAKIKADLVWEVGNPEGLVKEIQKLFSQKSAKKSFGKAYEIYPPGQGERSRYFLKIQDGCQQFCSYCIIPYSRGVLASRPKEEVLAETQAVIDAGYDEIVLCGIHLGLYGKEKNSTTCDLKTLLGEMVKLKGLGRIRLSSIEVTDVDNELLEFISKSKKICRHLHFPLQAGSDKILTVMNRPYTTEYFRKKVQRARALMPDLALTTDVIVGFPGESEQDFKETLRFCRELNFSRIHVFPFSAHEKTPAAKLTEQLSTAVKKERANRLRQVSEEMTAAYQKNFSGKKLDVIVERMDSEIWGKTEFYFDIKQKKDAAGSGRSLKVGKLVKLRKEV